MWCPVGIVFPSTARACCAAGRFSESFPFHMGPVLGLRGHCQPEGESLRNINKKPQGTSSYHCHRGARFPGNATEECLSLRSAGLLTVTSQSMAVPAWLHWTCPSLAPVPACIVLGFQGSVTPITRAQELWSLACQVPARAASSLMGSQGRCCLPSAVTGREWRGRQPGHEPGTPETPHPALPQRLRGAPAGGRPFLREGWMLSCH